MQEIHPWAYRRGRGLVARHTLSMSCYALAQRIGVNPPRVYNIVKGRRDITADTALRLARLFGTSPVFWINLQGRYDLEVEEEKIAEAALAEIQPFAHA